MEDENGKNLEKITDSKEEEESLVSRFIMGVHEYPVLASSHLLPIYIPSKRKKESPIEEIDDTNYNLLRAAEAELREQNIPIGDFKELRKEIRYLLHGLHGYLFPYNTTEKLK